MSQTGQDRFEFLCLRYGIDKDCEWLGNISEWNLFEVFLNRASVSAEDVLEYNTIWNGHPKRQQVSVRPVITPIESSEYDGIQDLSTALPRSQLVTSLYDLVIAGASRFVHVGAPAASGKTSLLQLFQRFCSQQGVTCIYVSMLMKNFKGKLLRKTGINADTWMMEPAQDGRCICADSSQKFVVMLDDAQERYSDSSLWSGLIKSDFEHNLPANIKFIVSATYSMCTDFMDLKTLPKLVRDDLRLSEEEAREFIRLTSKSMNAEERVGGMLVEPAIQNLVIAICNGHIGTLAVSVREMVKEFCRDRRVTVEEMVSFYLSNDMASRFTRCYSSRVQSLPEDMRTTLVKCLTLGPQFVSESEDPALYLALVRSGVLEELPNGAVTFTTPAAARYIHRWLFPRRSIQTESEVRVRGVFALMKAVLTHISANALRQAVTNQSTDVSSEAIFHHLLLSGLHAHTPGTCFICPELSKNFPPPPSHGPGVVESAAGVPPVSGRFDYYLGGALQWVIEVLLSDSRDSGNGSGAGEPLSRLENGSEGKYVGLAYTDHVVVDIQVSATGEPTPVQRNERRMSVFFKQGDFSYCNVLYGLGPVAERIILAN